MNPIKIAATAALFATVAIAAAPAQAGMPNGVSLNGITLNGVAFNYRSSQGTEFNRRSIQGNEMQGSAIMDRAGSSLGSVGIQGGRLVIRPVE